MAKVYNSSGFIDGAFQVIGRRADGKAYVLQNCVDPEGAEYYVAYYCAERSTGSFEHLDFACRMQAFATQDEAVQAVRAKGFAL